MNVVMDEAYMTTHYADDANSERLWNATGTKTEVKLPRMAVVQLALVLFLLEQPRLTNELYDTPKGKIVQPDTMGEQLRQDNCDMLIK